MERAHGIPDKICRNNAEILDDMATVFPATCIPMIGGNGRRNWEKMNRPRLPTYSNLVKFERRSSGFPTIKYSIRWDGTTPRLIPMWIPSVVEICRTPVLNGGEAGTRGCLAILNIFMNLMAISTYIIHIGA